MQDDFCLDPLRVHISGLARILSQLIASTYQQSLLSVLKLILLILHESVS